MRSGNNPEAIDILNAEYDRFNLIVKKIDRLEQFLEEQTKVEQREFYQSIQNTVTLSLAVAVIGAGLVVFFGIMTYRRIKSGLAYAEHTLFSVSETLDFSAKIHGILYKKDDNKEVLTKDELMLLYLLGNSDKEKKEIEDYHSLVEKL